MVQKYRKDTLKSFDINLTNQFIRKFKLSRTQLTQNPLVHIKKRIIWPKKYIRNKFTWFIKRFLSIGSPFNKIDRGWDRSKKHFCLILYKRINGGSRSSSFGNKPKFTKIWKAIFVNFFLFLGVKHFFPSLLSKLF